MLESVSFFHHFTLGYKEHRGVAMPAQILAWATRRVVGQPTELENTGAKARCKEQRALILGPNQSEGCVSCLGGGTQQAFAHLGLELQERPGSETQSQASPAWR